MIEPTFVQNYEDNTYTVSVCCVLCTARVEAVVNAPDVFKYRQGEYVQYAFPYLSDGEREALFISGICGRCYDKMFGED